MQALSKLGRLLNDEIYPRLLLDRGHRLTNPPSVAPGLIVTLMKSKPLQLHFLQSAQGATKGKF